MKLARKSLSFAAVALISVGLMSPVAQAQAERIVAPEEQDAYVQEFFQDGDVTPVVDGSGGLTDAEIEAFHQAVRDAQEAGPLNDEIIAGEMLSDKIILPQQVDKATSDEAEVAVAQQQSQTQMFATTAATCQHFPFSPHQVCGAILQRYNQMGGLLSILLDPIGRQIQNPDGVGFHQQFRNGFIFWHPDTGAHAITARNAEVFARNGWSAGWMGYPLGGEVPVSGSNPIDGELNGWVQLFQGGRIYRTPVLEGFQVASINGLILDKWLAFGGADSDLGLPIADEAKTLDGIGRFSKFQFGTMYWHPNAGTFEVSGLIAEVWAQNGSETGRFGFPTSDPYMNNSGHLVQDFEGGFINLTAEINAAGHSNYFGKEVNNLLIASLTRQALGSSSQTGGALIPLNQRNTTQAVRPNNGGITIPVPPYIYNPDLGNLNDYCTKSPDIFDSALTEDADFAGACARHDICYDTVDNSGGGSARYASCNRQFKDHLLTVCKNVYQNQAFTRQTCLMQARTYYEVVVAFHPTHWSGHITT